MSMGLPAVGYKSCSAVNELIQNGKNGFLCNDGAEALRTNMEKLMDNKELRVMMGNNAIRSVERFSPEIIWSEWEKLIEDIKNENHAN